MVWVLCVILILPWVFFPCNPFSFYLQVLSHVSVRLLISFRVSFTVFFSHCHLFVCLCFSAFYSPCHLCVSPSQSYRPCASAFRHFQVTHMFSSVYVMYYKLSKVFVCVCVCECQKPAVQSKKHQQNFPCSYLKMMIGRAVKSDRPSTLSEHTYWHHSSMRDFPRLLRC